LNGDLKIEEVQGNSYVNTTSGDIAIKKAQGSIEAEATAGDISFWDVIEAKNVKANTLSGDVLYWGNIMPGGRYSLKSYSGDVEIVIPEDSAFDLKAVTLTGDINCEFDVTFSEKFMKNQVQGSINGGGADVSINVFSGDIEVKKK
jgi:DUF4097 and DUF4098 domain-containing protein YvlB